MKLTIEGLSEIDSFLKQVTQEVKDEILTTLQSEIKRRTPIDTGRARKGWQRRKDSIRNDVPYIGYLEQGHSKQAPRGFTNQAVTATLSKRKLSK
jgi:hypothetical protein